jgi:sulfatase maturation enzyme AslB (radical SAM superfamily)
MSFESTFCSSPWLHMRITHNGTYDYCRWGHNSASKFNISNTHPIDFFQKHMKPVRDALLAGESIPECNACYQMEQHEKVSGRQRQLLKIGVRPEQFEKTLASSPWVKTFVADEFTQTPQDWQVDLGNYCNSACVFCSPVSSSKLATEHFKLGLIPQLPPEPWTNRPELIQRFVDTLTVSSNIQYIHFIGGETLITPAFKTILVALIQAGLHRTATIGLTTNLFVWRQDIVELLQQFQGVNLGMSVEAFAPVNDYVRWPSTLDTVIDNTNRWIKIATQHNWHMQFRITPTVLSISNLLSVYDMAWQHNIAVESCNFLQDPDHMRPGVLPKDMRDSIVSAMKNWIVQHPIALPDHVINTRDPNIAQTQMVQDLQSYVNYLENSQDESHRLPDLIAYLKKLEGNRNNSILTYLPEYEELFRSAGY